MEGYFKKYRTGIIGIKASFPTIEGKNKGLLYADWAATGRNYAPIELQLQENIMPLIANIEGEASITRWATSYAYRSARAIIKQHVNASPEDVIVTACAGSTRMIRRFQQILGFCQNGTIPDRPKVVVFVTHMEHYSNEVFWTEAGATVERIQADENGLVCLKHLETLLFQYRDWHTKIASVTACSNITGIESPYYDIAQMMHEAGGYCFVDFAYSAPYVSIDMHPEKKNAHLDAVFFSTHKFLGGPGTAAVLIFNRKVYKLQTKHCHKAIQNQTAAQIEHLEDDGSPAILQTIKAAMCIKLKEEMGVPKIQAREHQLLSILWDGLSAIPNLHILAPKNPERLGIFSFFIRGLDTYWAVRMLNDKFGIQCKAGKSVAHTYGHELVKAHLKKEEQRNSAVLFWIRVSLHPTMTTMEVQYIRDSIIELAEQHRQWRKDYSTMPCEGFSPILKERIDITLKHEFAGTLPQKS